MTATSPGNNTLRTSDAVAADADAVDAAIAASGDAHAFERLYRRHVNRMHTLVRRMLGEDADDVTQEVLIRAWQKLGTFRGRVGLRHLAAPAGGEPDPESSGRAAADCASGFWSSRNGTRCSGSPAHRRSRSISRPRSSSFPDGARQIFVLHDVEGYRHEEIAGMLGISVGTSKSQLHYARMALRKHLG